MWQGVSNARTEEVFVPVAKVMVTSGDFYAVDNEQVARPLERRSAIYEGDLLVTGPHSKAQVLFTDGSSISLVQNTDFYIEDYSFDRADPTRDKHKVKVTKGGVKLLTGEIGRRNPKAYRVITPMAAIGVQGTFFSMKLIPEGLFLGVSKGAITVFNEFGSLKLGMLEQYRYGYVGTDDGVPRGLDNQPEELDSSIVRGMPGIDQPIRNPSLEIKIEEMFHDFSFPDHGGDVSVEPKR